MAQGGGCKVGVAAIGAQCIDALGLARQQRYVAETLTEEWRLAPGALEVAWFAEETTAVERDVAALTKRLEKLEGK